jgi:hypothetical protein
MTDIVNRGAPNLTIKKQIRARVSCPNCDAMLDLDAEEVDIGHIIKCDSCEKNTYYPFERPWYRRRKLIVGYVLSLIVAFILGLAVNYVYDLLKSRADSAPAQSTKKG